MGSIKKIKLMHLINCYTLAGAEILAYNIIEKIDKSKFDISICSIGAHDLEIENQIKDRLKKEGITVLNLNKPSQKKRFSSILSLAEILKQNKIEILNTHCSSPDFYGKLAGFLAGVPLVYSTVHNDCGYKKDREKFFRHFTTKYIAISDYIKTFMLDRINVPENKIKLIYNGVKFSDINDVKDLREKKLKELNIDPGKIVITNVGRIVPLKGQNFLIEAAKEVVDKNKNVHFMIVGNDKLDLEWTNNLKNLVKDLGLENNITFTGARNDIEELMAISDLFVFPSTLEGLPLTVLEAMAAGLPVIATDVGSINEVVHHNINGLLIPSGNKEVISQNIIKLLNDKERSERMALEAKKLARSKYSIVQTAKNYEELYLEDYSKLKR
ncbi:MAG TPA: glycosyltransferase family 4 protein [Clostridia bacterium]